jgi:hypothetical protein
MKELRIKNFTKAVMDMDSDYFTIKYATEVKDKYVLGIDTNDVVSFKPLTIPKHYKMAIHKKKEDGSDNFTVWLWDMEKNMSYPMSIWVDDVSSISNFARFLTNTLTVADEDGFSGHKGNMITLK